MMTERKTPMTFFFGKKNTSAKLFDWEGGKKNSKRCVFWSALIGLEGQNFGVSKLIYC